jgi:hypothetical protein
MRLRIKISKSYGTKTGMAIYIRQYRMPLDAMVGVFRFSVSGIRIQHARKKLPRKKNATKIHVLTCWMFSFFGVLWDSVTFKPFMEA